MIFNVNYRIQLNFQEFFYREFNENIEDKMKNIQDIYFYQSWHRVGSDRKLSLRPTRIDNSDLRDRSGRVSGRLIDLKESDPTDNI